MQLHYLLVVIVVSDVKVMSSTVAVIFAITWVVNNYNIWTEPCFFFNGTEPNSFRTESEFVLKTELKLNWNKEIYSTHLYETWRTVSGQLMFGCFSEAERPGFDVNTYNDVQSPSCKASAVFTGAVCDWSTPWQELSTDSSRWILQHCITAPHPLLRHCHRQTGHNR